MRLNEKIADFTLQTDEDKTVSLSDYAGWPVVLFFYPRADTPGCTIEAEQYQRRNGADHGDRADGMKSR